MTRDEAPGPVDARQRLALLEPDAVRAARTRARCRAALARQRAVHAGKATRTAALEKAEAVPSRLSPVAIGAFCLLCAAYVGELVVTAVRLLSR